MVLFLVYSVILLAMVAVVNYRISQRISCSYVEMENFLPYQKWLEKDEFSRLPVKKWENCEFVILDEEYSPLFSTSSTVTNALTKQDIDLVNDYQQNMFYWICPNQERNGEPYTIIFQGNQQEDVEPLSYCILNEQNEIVEGNLFPDLDRLTDQQLELLGGIYQNRKTVERYTYHTTTGAERTLILFSRFFNYQDYAKLEKETNRLWLLMIPVILFSILLFSMLLREQLKTALKPLELAIVSYSEGKRMTEQEPLPSEVRQVVNSFDRMLTKIEDSQQKAAHESEEKQRILADISHDIKTPLTVIQCYSKALADHIVPQEQVDEYTQLIYHRSEMMADMVTSLVDYTRLEHPDFSINPVKTDFCEFCRAYFSERYQEIVICGFELDIDIPEEPIDCDIDASMMRRVLENLTNNALKYNPKGTTLSISIQKGTELCWLLFGDDGVGISERIRDTLFMPFVSGNHARTSGGGSGLGLFIVQRIIQLHGGKVTLSEQPKKGLSTEFCITLMRSKDG